MIIDFTGGVESATQNNGSPETRAPMVLGINYTLLSIAVLIVSSRILVKAKLRKLAVEDAFIVAATVRYLSPGFASFQPCTDSGWPTVPQRGTGGAHPPLYGSLCIAAVCTLY